MLNLLQLFITFRVRRINAKFDDKLNIIRIYMVTNVRELINNIKL